MTMQLDLFGTAAPSPARRPAKADTALLLAMSADHTTAATAPRSAPQPNAHGVYCEPTEALRLPRQVKDWQGGNLADIELLDLGSYCIWSTGYQLHSGDSRGAASPLADYPRVRQPTRGEALAAAAAYLRERLDGLDNADARRIIAWLGEIDQDRRS